MTCSHPVRLFGPPEMLVPCGKCLACKIAHSREWAIRVVHEAQYHERNVFATLTYNDEHLPSNLSICKRELQLFFKRLRKSIEPQKIKYYACGEYGERFHRPHYHAIIFGLGLPDYDVLLSAWGQGFIKLGSVTYDSARYVADYIGKKYTGKYADKYVGRLQPFQLQSKGLGLQFALDNRQRLVDSLDCTIRGRHVGLPRYYKRKLEIPTEVLFAEGNEHRKLIAEFYRYLDDKDVYPQVRRALYQHDKNLKAKYSRRHSKL